MTSILLRVLAGFALLAFGLSIEASEPVKNPGKQPAVKPGSTKPVERVVPPLKAPPLIKPLDICTDCPDLVAGSCQIACKVGTYLDASVCASDGYKSNFEFRVTLQPGVRNTGKSAATLPANARLYQVSGPASEAWRAPSTGLFIDVGATASHVPAVSLSDLAAGHYVIRFDLDDGLVLEQRANVLVTETRCTTEKLQVLDSLDPWHQLEAKEIA